jgi:hypothetical protein
MRIVIDDNCLNRQGGNGGASYDDSAILARLQKLENRTDNFVKDVTVSREGNKVKFTYTRVDGTSSEAEFDDKDTVALTYDDTELRQRVTQLEAREDNDKQTLSLQDRTLSISNGNSVTLPASGGSMSSAISAYSGSYINSAYDNLIKGNSIKAEDNVTELVPNTSNGNLQVIQATQGIFLRTRSVNGNAIVAPLTHENTEPKFNQPTPYPQNSPMAIFLGVNDNEAEIAYTSVITGEHPENPFSVDIAPLVYFDRVSIVFDSSSTEIALTLYKGSHVYTMSTLYTSTDELNELTFFYNFPAYADFGLEDKFNNIKLTLRC